MERIRENDEKTMNCVFRVTVMGNRDWILLALLKSVETPLHRMLKHLPTCFISHWWRVSPEVLTPLHF